jgi:hypothetical protein
MPEADEDKEPQNDQLAQGEPDQLGDAGKRALEAERRRAAAAERDAKALKAKLDEIEAANLSEVEKATKRATDAESRLVEIERTILRQQVAIDKGLPAKWVDRLRGDSAEELAADADEILADLAAKAPDTAPAPRPDLTQGAKGKQGGLTTAQQFADAIGAALNH